ncbi:DeoR/GlpR family DNA-binding transcription regulator [Clostridium beijerinckii]|uniref:DeoR/GlpR family transcriptional regulator of sugar metabolism n=1 Tax=Clostridium beijerinckii TaxID=1520 RepID=A0A9Q5CUK8_CLOBE|nr:DeoR/GlpR family DNA-binding transcription regulator [Clostridium beijerinckii]AQS06297.1 glucitol operon repressor [Clostridium beijerinckii]MBA2888341.1 DeoR/GlpR family transcriptional regulator of sugar metabolism [Clostridium beijerinckii]MBA2903109.1 DeoR/GlpR family transcriptional regulator of sugar metabolism [Clostridium beijerinckii]MBA2912929.1 DeoR/GlpR family transcriptional regulator of sugar metabolism [Clostridium beijerinckii]MBA9014090.1 DeoR/GlpR family transcriptional r
MFTEERLEQILNILNKHGRVKVKELSEQFNVSEGMIRKDLQRLEKDGALQRTYGGAIINRKISKSISINTRMKVNLSSKELIAKKAFDLIDDGDVIFLESSSINFFLAKLIANNTKKITLVTNMPIILPLFNDNETVILICIGGVYDKRDGGVLGSEAIKSIYKYTFNKGFVGSSGVNLITNSVGTVLLEDGNIKELIISNSKEVFLLVETEKFNVDSPYRFANIDEFDAIITDSNITDDIEEQLNNLTVKLI